MNELTNFKSAVFQISELKGVGSRIHLSSPHLLQLNTDCLKRKA